MKKRKERQEKLEKKEGVSEDKGSEEVEVEDQFLDINEKQVSEKKEIPWSASPYHSNSLYMDDHFSNSRIQSLLYFIYQNLVSKGTFFLIFVVVLSNNLCECTALWERTHFITNTILNLFFKKSFSEWVWERSWRSQ